MKLNPELKKDDRIILIRMDDEHGVPAFTKGAVKTISKTPFGVQYVIEWENGSKLDLIPEADKWMLESDFIEMKRRKTGLKESANVDWFLNNLYINEHFNTQLISKFLNLVRESGIVNMFGASPLLYMGSDMISRLYESDNESFEELLEIADDVKNEVIMGTISYLEEKEDGDVDLNKIQRYVQRLSQKLLEYWMKSH